MKTRLLFPLLSMLVPAVLLAFLVPTAPAVAQQGDLECGVSREIPTERENGDELPIEELGGYELRVTPPGGEQQTVLLTDPTTTEYADPNCEPGEYHFRAAAYDTDGLYSNFVDLQPVAGDQSRPGAPSGLQFWEQRPDPTEKCGEDCTIIDSSSRTIIRGGSSD